jgi:uncharacterized protein YjiK
MIKTFKGIAAASIALALAFSGGKNNLKSSSHKSVKIPEPSDVCYSASGNSLYIVSDNGYLFETDTVGNVLRQSAFTGYDFEGVCIKGSDVYVADEQSRKVHRLDAATLSLKRTYSVPYGGAMNKGYESITWNATTNKFILVTEKEPTKIIECDSAFNILNDVTINIAADISACTWYNNALWLLSDEDSKIIKLDPVSYKALQSWNLNILNPEGLAINKNGVPLVAADDLRRLYFFNQKLQ